MNTINDSYASHGQPFSSSALSFLQNSQFQMLQQIGYTFNWAYASEPVILWGCEVSVSGIYTTISAGAVFVNNGTTGYEILNFVGQTFLTPTAGNVIISNLGITYDDGPPGTSFADGTFAQIREIRSVEWTTGPSGSGTLPDFSAYWTFPPLFTVSPSGLNGLMVKLNANNTYVMSGTPSSSNVITLNFANASIGARITIVGFIEPTNTISISTTGSNFVKSSSLIAPASASYTIIEITYLGLSGSTQITATNVSYDV